LRKFVDRLIDLGEVKIHDEPVPLTELSAIIEGTDKAVLFKKAGPERVELVAKTAGNRKRIATERARLEAAENARRDAAQTVADRLQQVSLTFSARVGDEEKLFGSVTAADIAQQLHTQGFPEIEKRQIDLHEPIKALGVYRVPIRLHAEVKPDIKVWVIKQ